MNMKCIQEIQINNKGEMKMKIRVVCSDCGFYTDFTEKDIRRYKKLHQVNYFPQKIECGNCRNNGDYTTCTQITILE